jgi:UDP-N-acetylglucosamine--N-acetylmuramyl-(pentapeptide) pyrophosphoryl-undecaprenol N-acetylglucosamine transferase
MDLAYAAADVVMSRAGAMSISELSLLNKAVVFVPLPTAAEDHQTKNAMALVNKNAAMYVKDSEAADVLLNTALATIKDEAKLLSLSDNIMKLGLKNSADIIADEVVKLAWGTK